MTVCDTLSQEDTPMVQKMVGLYQKLWREKMLKEPLISPWGQKITCDPWTYDNTPMVKI